MSGAVRVRVRGVLGALAAVVLALLVASPTLAVGRIVWARQIGSVDLDGVSAMTVLRTATGPEIYVTGFWASPEFTNNLCGAPADWFVARYRADGTRVWFRLFGAGRDDRPTAITADASGVYVGGYVDCDLEPTDPQPPQASVRKLARANGATLWTHPFGDAVAWDQVSGLAVDATGLYIGGETWGQMPGAVRGPNAGSIDVFVRRLINLNAVAPTVAWTRQFGMAPAVFGDPWPAEKGGQIALGPDSVYLLGDYGFENPFGAGGRNFFAARLGRDGSFRWLQPYGSAGTDVGTAILADTTGVYIGGATTGDLDPRTGNQNLGSADGFVGKVSLDLRTVLWVRHVATRSGDNVRAMAMDESGLYATGETYGVFAGQTRTGSLDSYVRRMSRATGNGIWTKQFGAGDRLIYSTIPGGIATSAVGVFVGGSTDGHFEKPVSNKGLTDAWVLRMTRD